LNTSTKAHWDERAADTRHDDIETTHPDIWQRWLEIETIKPWLRTGERVLDVGCGTGYAARIFAPLVGELIGIDFSEQMILRAQAGDNPTNLSFRVADVRQLDAAGLGTFDTIVSVRCLINILDRVEQYATIDQITAALRPGGRFILIEGKFEGRQALNEQREAHGLDPMPTVWHNRDFRERELLAHLAQFYYQEFKRGFGYYDYLSRVVHPHLIKPREPAYDAEINQIAAHAAMHKNVNEALSRVIALVMRKHDQAASKQVNAM